MKNIRFTLACALATVALLTGAPAQALESLKILVPAAPGGGWDQTGRALQAAIQSEKIVPKVTVDNKGGAGGTIGLAQFVSSSKGDPNAMMMGGMVMVGAIISNKSPVNLTQVTPIARLTGEYEVVVVPASSKIQTLKELIHQRTEKVLSDLREGPIGRLIPGAAKSEPPKPGEAAADPVADNGAAGSVVGANARVETAARSSTAVRV